MPKLQVSLPRCPDLRQVRGDFRELHAEIRQARARYVEACWQKAMAACTGGLTGKRLVSYLVRMGETMQRRGLYAQATFWGDICGSLMRQFYHKEVTKDRRSTSSYHPTYLWWKTWQQQRGITEDLLKELRGCRPGRGYKRRTA